MCVIQAVFVCDEHQWEGCGVGGLDGVGVELRGQERAGAWWPPSETCAPVLIYRARGQCTQTRPGVHLLHTLGGPESRLSPSFCVSLSLSALF